MGYPLTEGLCRDLSPLPHHHDPNEMLPNFAFWSWWSVQRYENIDGLRDAAASRLDLSQFLFATMHRAAQLLLEGSGNASDHAAESRWQGRPSSSSR